MQITIWAPYMHLSCILSWIVRPIESLEIGYVYIHDVGTPAMFLNLVGVVIRWPTKAPAYAVDVAWAGGGGDGKATK